MNIQQDKVVVDLIEVEVDAGLVISKRNKRPTEGKVVFSGNKVAGVEKGDTVLFESHKPMKWDKGLYILNLEDIKAVRVNEEEGSRM